MDPYKILKYPLMGEKATIMREKENTLTFTVDKSASKKQIQQAVEEIFKVKIINIRVINAHDGIKKAHVRLDKKHSADEIASQMGVI
jgi:large subunit ribosomal protein L23